MDTPGILPRRGILKQLIVNADDFGYTRGVNRAIVDAHRTGIVTSTSLMANGAAFEDAVRLARETPTLDVGCHLNLVEGTPVSPPETVSRLVGIDGRFYNLVEFFLRMLAGQIGEQEIEREFTAQIERMLQAGVRPSHLDTHQHTHLHPAVTGVLARVAARYDIRWARRLCENCTPPLRQGALRRRVVAACARLFVNALQRRMDAHGVRTPDAFTGFVLTGRLNRQSFLATLSHLPDGITELMCHPGYYDADLRQAPTMLKSKREIERRIVGDGYWRGWLQERGVALTSFRELFAEAHVRA